MLLERLEDVVRTGKGEQVIAEIVLQSRVDFNVEEENGDIVAFDKVVESNAEEEQERLL